MAKFYSCKHPVVIGQNEKDEPITLPVGSVFDIKSMSGDHVHLSPVKQVPVAKPLYFGLPGHITVSVGLLQFGFTENDFIN